MEILARLENIEFFVKQLQTKCRRLEDENENLTSENEKLKKTLNKKELELVNIEETNKISKLAQGVSNKYGNQELKKQIDLIIKEIDSCLTLVKK